MRCRVGVQVLDPPGVEGAGPSDDTMNLKNNFAVYSVVIYFILFFYYYYYYFFFFFSLSFFFGGISIKRGDSSFQRKNCGGGSG